MTGKFAIAAPGPLNETESNMDLGRMHMVGTLKLPERIRYFATCIVSDKPRPREEVLGKLTGIESRRELEVAGRPAVELESEGNRSALIVFDGNRFCMLTVEPYSKLTPRPVADVRRFFDSLRLE